VPPQLELPCDRPRPAVQSFRGRQLGVALSMTLSEALAALARSEGATLFMTQQADFKILLHRTSGSEDIVVGTPIAGRNRREIEGLIGFFVNTLVLRTDLSRDTADRGTADRVPTYRELLARVRRVSLDAYAHQDLPFERVVEELRLPRNMSYTPLFQVMFVLQNAPGTSLELPDLTMSSLPTRGEAAMFDLTLTLQERETGVSGSLEYNTDLFDRTTMARLLAHFELLLAGIVDDPEQRLGELPWLTQPERHQLLAEWCDTRTDAVRERSIQELFELQVETMPDASAVVFERSGAPAQRLSYRELNRRANQLAHYLRSLGVGPEVLVGVCVERSPEMVVALLGVLKAGGVWVPLDPEYPRERLAFMLEDTGISVLVTHQRLRRELPEHAALTVCPDAETDLLG
ncbi:MAG: AMP-binding protein, partial [bacterium]|nr:AMP-binding protein [bacterium]